MRIETNRRPAAHLFAGVLAFLASAAVLASGISAVTGEPVDAIAHEAHLIA